jgi:hypothetical protein
MSNGGLRNFFGHILQTLCRMFLPVPIALVLITSDVLAQEDIPHLNAGATRAEYGAPLWFPEGDDFAAESGYLVPLRFAAEGRYAGWYQNEIVFGVYPTLPGLGGPYPYSALPGTVVWLEIPEVRGPEGGVFTFWQTRSNSPTVSVPVGTVDRDSAYRLTDGSGRPGTDPAGHRHGRRFAVNLPGTYEVVFQLSDRGTNGARGGPIHGPSRPFTLRFLAQPDPFTPPPNLGRPRLTLGGMELRLVSESRVAHALEVSGDLKAWTRVSTFTTTNSVQTLVVGLEADGRFCRVVRLE